MLIVKYKIGSETLKSMLMQGPLNTALYVFQIFEDFHKLYGDVIITNAFVMSYKT